MSDRSTLASYVMPAVDTVSAASVVAVLTGLLPAIATVFAVIWYAIMIFDWFENRRMRRAAATAARVVSKATTVAAGVVAEADRVAAARDAPLTPS